MIQRRYFQSQGLPSPPGLKRLSRGPLLNRWGLSEHSVRALSLFMQSRVRTNPNSYLSLSHSHMHMTCFENKAQDNRTLDHGVLLPICAGAHVHVDVAVIMKWTVSFTTVSVITVSCSLGCQPQTSFDFCTREDGTVPKGPHTSTHLTRLRQRLWQTTRVRVVGCLGWWCRHPESYPQLSQKNL